jgi:hypothetical protein
MRQRSHSAGKSDCKKQELMEDSFRHEFESP